LKVSENSFWVIFVSKLFDAGTILFILAKLISRNVSWLTELNIQRGALESLRKLNVYLHGKACRLATGSNLSGFFFSNCSFTSSLLELNKLAFERMLQEELSVKVVLKSSEEKNKPTHCCLSGPHVFPCCFSLFGE